jgi:hypothetical protein
LANECEFPIENIFRLFPSPSSQEKWNLLAKIRTEHDKEQLATNINTRSICACVTGLEYSNNAKKNAAPQDMTTVT